VAGAGSNPVRPVGVSHLVLGAPRNRRGRRGDSRGQAVPAGAVHSVVSFERVDDGTRVVERLRTIAPRPLAAYTNREPSPRTSRCWPVSGGGSSARRAWHPASEPPSHRREVARHLGARLTQRGGSVAFLRCSGWIQIRTFTSWPTSSPKTMPTFAGPTSATSQTASSSSMRDIPMLSSSSRGRPEHPSRPPPYGCRRSGQQGCRVGTAGERS